MATTTLTYEIRPIDPAVVNALRDCDDAGRRPRLVTSHEGGSPLRCCLRASRPDEPVFLASYAPLRRWAHETHADPGAYDEVGPVFIHAEPCRGPDSGGIPMELFDSRRMLRSYDCHGAILGGRIVETDEEPEAVIEELFADPQVAIVHARAIEFGCFTFEIRRALRNVRLAAR
jgi:Protein of unknown function (DUF1203)